jgi:hypothetical protein
MGAQRRLGSRNPAATDQVSGLLTTTTRPTLGRCWARTPLRRKAGETIMNRSKQRGTAWESRVVSFLQEHGWPHAERRALHGSQDKGDILGIPGWVIECKNASRLELAEWVKELQAEIRNARTAHGALWLKRRGKTSAADAYVVLDGQTFVELLKAAGYQ